MYMTIFTIFMATYFIFVVYASIRNNKVYKWRTKIIEDFYILYKYLPSYSEMMYWHFNRQTFSSWLDYANNKGIEKEIEKEMAFNRNNKYTVAIELPKEWKQQELF